MLAKKKQGLDIPVHDWLRGHLKPLLLDTLNRKTVEESGLDLVASSCNTVLNLHMQRKANYGYHLWGMLMLFLWIKQWKIQMRTGHSGPRGFFHRFRVDLLVLLVSCCIFLPLVASPPHLMDDVDAVQAQIARNMLESGDWVTARLDGVAYLEKSPLIYWIMARSYRIFGVHDWAARLPLALINIALCWVTARFAMWAFGRRAGIYSGHDSGDLHRDISVSPGF